MTRARPVRTCIGCRTRAPVTELLRVVVVEDGADRVGDDRARAVPDPSRSLPGRGAHLHPDPACHALAVRRRAFGRALRFAGVLDTGALADYLAGSSPEMPQGNV